MPGVLDVTDRPAYSSRAVSFLDRRRYVLVSGSSPWVQWVFHPNRYVHDFAFDMLRDESRRQRWPWWRPTPPAPVWDMHWIDVGDLDVVLGWLLTAWAIWRQARRSSS